MSVLRADARRNRERVLAAAAEAFAEEGPDVSVDEIARRAGVGHATVFRRFPTKEALVEAVVAERVQELRALADAALAAPDAGAAFDEFVWQVAELHASERGLHECLVRCGAAPGAAELERAAVRIVDRAQRAGAVRRDLPAPDVPGLVRAALKAAPADRWRRHLEVVLDGLRPRVDTARARG